MPGNRTYIHSRKKQSTNFDRMGMEKNPKLHMFKKINLQIHRWKIYFTLWNTKCFRASRCWENVKGKVLKFLSCLIMSPCPPFETHLDWALTNTGSASGPPTLILHWTETRSLNFELVSQVTIGNSSVRGLGARITSCSFTKLSLDLFHKEVQVTSHICGTCPGNTLPISSVEPQNIFSCTLCISMLTALVKALQ